MYLSHPLVEEPQTAAKLWRYMDLAKFLHLLNSASLHLAALRTFEDPFEGHPPKSVIAQLTKQPNDITPKIRTERLAIIENNLKMFKNSRNSVFASCWHMNETESAGMWSQYIRAGEGIAVQTTFERLKTSISEDSHPVSGAIAKYVDFETYVPTDFNVLVWGILKRSSYSHEKEFRLVALQQPGPLGIAAPVNLEVLIENIYVAPTTPNWLLDLIKSLIAKFYIGAPIVRSELLNPPDYFHVPAWAKDA